MIFTDRDPLAGAERDAVFISAEDARTAGEGDGDPVLVRSSAGEVAARARLAPIRPRDAEMLFPECNPLVRAGVRDLEGRVPDDTVAGAVVPAAQRSG